MRIYDGLRATHSVIMRIRTRTIERSKNEWRRNGGSNCSKKGIREREWYLPTFYLTHPDQRTPSISFGGRFNSQNLIPHGTELVTLEWLREEVCDHVIRRHVLDGYLPLLCAVADKKNLMLIWRDRSLRALSLSRFSLSFALIFTTMALDVK